MRRSKLHACFLSGAFILSCSFASLTYADDQSANILPPSPSESLLKEIRDTVLRFYSDFKNYYGVVTQEDIDNGKTTAPYLGPTSPGSDLSLMTASNNALLENKSRYTVTGLGLATSAGNVLDMLVAPPSQKVCGCSSLFDKDCACSFDGRLKNVAGEIFKFATLPMANPYIPSGATPPYASIAMNKANVEGAFTDYSGAAEPNPNNAVNLNGLLGPLTYDPTGDANVPGPENIQAYNFVKFISGLAEPVSIPESLPATEKDPLRPYRYLARLRTYVAMQSVIMSNFSEMWASRVKNATTKKSRLEIEHDLVSRFMTKDWRDQMEKSPPLTINREILYQMALMNYQLYEQRLQQERQLATTSMLAEATLQAFLKSALTPESGVSPRAN